MRLTHSLLYDNSFEELLREEQDRHEDTFCVQCFKDQCEEEDIYEGLLDMLEDCVSSSYCEQCFADYYHQELESDQQQCMRVRCLSCGFVRAKNTTRQVEHLGICELFKNSPEGAAAVANGELEMAPSGNRNYTGGTDIWRGGAPNPNLLVGNTPHVTPTQRPMASNSRLPPPRPAPSLVAHLLNKHSDKVNKATQQPFLSHAGCGTLSGSALKTWLVQNGHISRALMSAIGGLIAKVRLPDVANTRADTSYRALDLLISTITNIRKEIDFIENTKHKYNLVTVSEPPSPMTKAYMDLLASVAAPQADLLEGMVALWATEHVCIACRVKAGLY